MEAKLDLRTGQVGIVIGVLRIRFQDFLGEITGGYRVDLICEEAKHGELSIAEQLAREEHIRYHNIEMPPAQRAELGIPAFYTVDPESEISPEQKALWNDQREGHMVYELLRAVEGARVVIVICGVLHMPILIHALSSKFHRVEQYNITTMPWFDESLL